MTLTAQYRPYRDEECLDNNSDHNGWTENEPAIQIYEKTTEDIPFQVKRYSLAWTISIFLIIGTFSFVLGYFSKSSTLECIHKPVSLSSTREEDITIRSKLLERISADRIALFTKEFATKSHLAGSEADIKTALHIQDFFKEQNFDRVTLKNYTVLLSMPDESRPNYVSVENESGMSTLNLQSESHAFSLYSPKGNVTGDIMFVNYGRPVDYLQIQELFKTSENIFSGKILLIKQYYISASEQYKYAMLMNASAILLYPDPQHYNPKKKKTYPETVWLPSDGVKSDSIFWNGAGDPETFGLPSNDYTFRDALEFSEQVTMLAQPISGNAAYELLQLMDGIKAPTRWKGGFNLTYKVGPGLKDNLKVRVSVNNQLKNKKIINVIGTIRGSIEPDRYVIIGNKRDSISKGAIDSASGTGVFLELARVFGELIKDGWKPRRTIMFCSWGAEEYNLIGSTEWVEEYHKLLNSRAVAYINVNLVVTGNDTLSVAASPLLYHAIFNATKDLKLPKPTENDENEEIFSVYHDWVLRMPVLRNSSTLVVGPNVIDNLSSLGVDEKINSEVFYSERHHLSHEDSSEPGTILKAYLEAAMQQIRPHVRTLDMYGSYAPFFTMAGIPALDLSFIKLNYDDETNEEGTYTQQPYPLLHTQYDELSIVDNQIDPYFRYHKLVAQLLAEIIRDLTDSLFLPFNLFDYAQLLDDFNFKSQHLHSIIVSNAPNLVFTENQQSFDLTHSDMSFLESAIQNFTKEVIRFHFRQDRVDVNDPMAIRRINDQLLLIERQFLDHRGMPTNNLKKHLILSPAETLSSMNALQTEGLFPALLDELDQIIGNVYKKDIQPSIVRLKKHLPILINTIQGAAESLADYF